MDLDVMTDESAAPATDSLTARARSVETFADRFEALGLSQLLESGHNPRTHFDPVKLADLAASIAQKGVVEPLVVRPLQSSVDLNPGVFEIIAGARRFRAARQAGLTHVPCVIRHYSDEDVLELTIIENIQRDDLDPLEEASGYRALIDANPGRYSAAYIAERIGKSEKYVWDRMKLLDLVPAAKGHLESGLITAGHGILLARLKPEDQLRALDVEQGGVFETEHRLWDPQDENDIDPDTGEIVEARLSIKAVTVRELEGWIARHVRFDVIQAANAAPLDFGPVAEKVDRAAAQPGRGRKVIAITHEYQISEDARDAKERTFTQRAWKRADGLDGSLPCEHAVLGVVSVGPGYGTAFDVCIEKDKCTVHWKAEIREREKNQKLRASGQATTAAKRETAIEAREQRERQERERLEARWKVFFPALRKAVAAAVAKVPANLPKAIYLKVLENHRLPANTTPAQLQKALLADAIKDRFDGYVFFRNEPELVAWAKVLGVDVKACDPDTPAQTSAVAKSVTRGRKPAAPPKKAKRR